MAAFRFVFVAVLALILVSCSPVIPPASSALHVRPVDLARYYRDNRQTASDAFNGQMVVLPVHSPIRQNGEVHWHLSDGRDYPPAIVFLFDPVPEKLVGPLWIEGVCQGRFDDGLVRDQPGFHFHLRITDCRIVPPPARPKP